MTSVQIVVPFPPRCLWSNSRTDRRFSTKDRQAFKTACHLCALERLGELDDLPWPGAASAAVFYNPDRRHRDPDNANASLKYAHDAVVKAGLLENDRHLTHLPPQMDYDKDEPRVLISYIRLDGGDPDTLNGFAAAMQASAARIAMRMKLA